VTGYPF